MNANEVFAVLRTILTSLERISDLTHPLPAENETKVKIDEEVAKAAQACSKLSELLAGDSK